MSYQIKTKFFVSVFLTKLSLCFNKKCAIKITCIHHAGYLSCINHIFHQNRIMKMLVPSCLKLSNNELPDACLSRKCSEETVPFMIIPLVSKRHIAFHISALFAKGIIFYRTQMLELPTCTPRGYTRSSCLSFTLRKKASLAVPQVEPRFSKWF